MAKETLIEREFKICRQELDVAAVYIAGSLEAQPPRMGYNGYGVYAFTTGITTGLQDRISANIDVHQPFCAYEVWTRFWVQGRKKAKSLQEWIKNRAMYDAMDMRRSWYAIESGKKDFDHHEWCNDLKWQANNHGKFECMDHSEFLDWLQECAIARAQRTANKTMEDIFGGV